MSEVLKSQNPNLMSRVGRASERLLVGLKGGNESDAYLSAGSMTERQARRRGTTISALALLTTSVIVPVLFDRVGDNEVCNDDVTVPYTVQRNDKLWNIAQSLNDLDGNEIDDSNNRIVMQIQDINNMGTSTDLIEGQTLMLPSDC